MSQDFRKMQLKINNLDSIWNNLTNKMIYFAHMSVGNNIINGINDIIKENKLGGLRIIETNKVDDFNAPVFGHSKNGINGEPQSKINSFSNLIRDRLGSKADIAFFKLCYVDVISNTNVTDLFNKYKNTMNILIKTYPNIKFIHFTVPLTTYKKRGTIGIIKDFIKSIIGRETSKEKDINDNVARNKFNELLKIEYRENVFDLAGLESTYPNGNRETLGKNEKESLSLIPDYTDDGGHLNIKGRMIIAFRLLEFLGKL